MRRVRRVRLARRVAALRVRVVVAQLVAVLAVHALVVLELAQPLVVALDLVSQRGVLDGGALLVQLQAARALQLLQVDPAAPPDAHAVHYEPRYDVDLTQNKKKNTFN